MNRLAQILGGFSLVALVVLQGCTEPRVLLLTGTTVGLDASPGDGQTRPPSIVFGYKRSEVAFVPTDGQLSKKGGQEKQGASPNPAGAGNQATAPDGKTVPEGSTDAYSTLAILNLVLNWFSSARIEQFIATGHAARDIEPEVAKAVQSLTAKR